MRLLLILTLSLFVVGTANADQRTDLSRVVSELDYLIDTVKSLQKQHQNDTSTVRFNYAAFLEQLITTRNRTSEYLNTDLNEIRLNPPVTIDGELSK